MELFFMTRGIKHEVDQFVNDMQAQFFPFSVQDPVTGNKQHIGLQGSLRPIQLWGYVFPEDQLDVVLATLNLPNEGNEFISGYKVDKKIWALRKMLGAKPIPKRNLKTIPRPIRKKDVNILGIGIREDIKKEAKASGKIQEMV
jgi:hypothetical protein